MITNFAVLGPVGRELIHSYSRPYPGYSVEETNKKIRHALEGAPMPCTAIKKIWDCGKNCDVSSPYLLYRTMPGSNRMDGVFALEDDGLYFRSDRADLSQKGLWLSSPIEVIAQTRDPQNGSWGRLVKFTDANGVLHQLILSMADLGGMETVCDRPCWNRDFEFHRTRRLGAFSFAFSTIQLRRCSQGWSKNSDGSVMYTFSGT